MKRLSAIVGLGVIGLALTVGGLDLYHGARRWSQMGPLPPGQPAPPFRVQMLEGGELTAHDLRDQVTVVTFWATWCPACRSELHDLDELDDAYVGKNVRFVAVNREGSGISPAQARPMVTAFAEHRKLGLPMAIDDGSMSKTFRVGPIPHTILFDREGNMRQIHLGRVSSSTIAEEIDELLAE